MIAISVKEPVSSDIGVIVSKTMDIENVLSYVGEAIINWTQR